MKKKENKYVVIGGQYRSFCYGCTPTLLGAKRLATQNEEYWDNWQGWHTPDIYRIEDTVEVDGERFVADAPAPFWRKFGKKWEEVE